MTVEQEISKLVRERLMEEINGLGIRAAIREQIEESGITKGKVAELVEQTVDSYVRSVNITTRGFVPSASAVAIQTISHPKRTSASGAACLAFSGKSLYSTWATTPNG